MRFADTIAAHFDTAQESLIALWREIATREGDVPNAWRLTYDQFRDHIPQFLERLSERLRGQSGNVLREGRRHGILRWHQGYDASHVVLELGHLRTTLRQTVFEFARRLEVDSTELEEVLAHVHDGLDEIMAESVAQYRDENLARSTQALTELERRQDELERERRLLESERLKLRIVLDSLPVGVWVLDAQGTVIHVNREGERLQGFPREDVVSRLNFPRESDLFYTLAHEDGTAYDPQDVPVSRALRGQIIDQEEIIWTVGNLRRIITVSAAPILDLSGQIVGALAAVQEISARKEAEQELRRQHQFIQAITDSMGEGLYVLDAEGHVTFMNPAAERMLGWSGKELADSGLTMHEAVHHKRPDNSPYPIDDCPLMHHFRERRPYRNDEAFIRRDGTLFPISLTMVPFAANNDFSGAVVTFGDITERVRLQSDLADSEARFRTIAEESPVLIWRAGLDGGCEFFNKSWLEFRGRTLEEEHGVGWAEGVHPEDFDRCLQTYHAAFERRESFHMTYRLKRHDGQYRWIDDHGTPLFDGRDRFLGYLGSCIDVTERVELEGVLRRQSELAEEASLHKTRLMSALSHDARTPLNAVALSAQLLQMHLGDDANPEVSDCLRMIQQSVKNVHDLLRDLLNLSRIDAGAVTVEASPFPLEQVLEECLSGITPQARSHGIELLVEAGPLAGIRLRTDRAKLKQVLSNLLSNALRFTEKGWIRLFGERAEDQIRIGVEDSGIGIAEADQLRIFDEFATLDNPHRPTGEGTGLGLAIGRRLANLLGGQILLESEPGKGSTFRIALPDTLIIAPDETEGLNLFSTSEKYPSTREGSPTHGGTILIADDDLANRLALARLLKRMGYQPREASNGREAVLLANQCHPLAILMDVAMPVMDGIDATRALRTEPTTRGIPIYALTGDVSISNRQRIGEAGVNGFLEKPVDPPELARVLSSLTLRHDEISRPGPDSRPAN